MLATGHRCTFAMRVRFNEQVTDPGFSFSLFDGRRIAVLNPSSIWEHPHSGTFGPGDEVTLRIAFDNVLAPGRYTVAPAVAQGAVIDRRSRMVSVVMTGTRSTEGVVDPPYDVVIERAGVPSVEDAVQ